MTRRDNLTTPRQRRVSRGALRPRGVRPVQRNHRPHLGHGPVPGHPDGPRHHLDRPQRRLGRLRWDKYPFILLNLAFSTQAAYAAPLILLAQNRQEERDRAQTENDRRRRTHPGRHRVLGSRARRRAAVTGRRGHHQRTRGSPRSPDRAVERLAERLSVNGNPPSKTPQRLRPRQPRPAATNSTSSTGRQAEESDQQQGATGHQREPPARRGLVGAPALR